MISDSKLYLLAERIASMIDGGDWCRQEMSKADHNMLVGGIMRLLQRELQ